MALCPFMSTPYIDKLNKLESTATGTFTSTGTSTSNVSGTISTSATGNNTITTTGTGTNTTTGTTSLSTSAETTSVIYGGGDKSGGIILIECRQSACQLWYAHKNTCSLTRLVEDESPFIIPQNVKTTIQSKINNIK